MISVIKNYKEQLHKRLILKFSQLSRLGLSARFIEGEGIEIGGLNYPLPVRPGVRAKYVDRISADEHMSVLSELKRKELVQVDIIDDGETLATIADGSQNFVIANHFIEHTRNPILAIKNAVRVLKTDGVFFMAVPDKRYTFDEGRKITTNDHLLRDFEQGPDWSEEEHWHDFVTHTDHSDDCKTEEDIQAVIRQLKDTKFSIHYHVWDHHAMLGLLMMLVERCRMPFEIELSLAPQKGGNEAIFILRKI